jgi:hypothetical protein
MIAERLAAGKEINVSNPFVPHSFALQIIERAASAKLQRRALE